MKLNPRRETVIQYTLWLASTICLTYMYLINVNNSIISLTGFATGILFILFLIYSNSKNIPKNPQVEYITRLDGQSFLIILAGIILGAVAIFIIAIVFHPWLLFAIISALISIILLIKNRTLTGKETITGIAIGLTPLAANIITGNNNTYMTIYGFTIPLSTLGGLILLKKTNITHIWLTEGNIRQSIKSFLTGCLLAIPAALLNTVLGTQQDTWANTIWKPFIGALNPGLGEEAVFRLFLLTFFYLLLVSSSKKPVRKSIITSVILSALIHAYVHFNTMTLVSSMIIPQTVLAILYGVPMGLLFVKKDYETAAGYHYLIDLMRFLAYYASIV